MARILLVEDNEMNRDMLLRRLAKRGFDVLAAVDGAEGLRLAAENSPDLILMDMSLPVVDGWEATRRLKRDPGTSRIPVIALTAHVLESDRQMALAAGCDGFETKPVDLNQLIATIDRLLAGNRPDST